MHDIFLRTGNPRRTGAACAGVVAIALLSGRADAAPDLHARLTVTPAGTIITPGSSLPEGQASHRVHTNMHIFVPAGGTPGDSAPGGKFETPASLACVYGLTKSTAGCDPEKLKTVAATGSRLIAIVDAYDDPTAAHDLAVYSAKYGLPKVTADNFTVAYATGKKPQQDTTGDWEVEESLDIEMAHALAPNARVVLVEAASSSFAELLRAERVAGALVAAAGGGEVSNSWGSSETAQEASARAPFEAKGAVFFAAAGDSPGTSVPSVLPDVVAVGGTSINRSASGRYESQTTWSSGGGGISAYLPVPFFQHAVANIVGTHRGAPDIAFVANPATGVWVYDSTPYSGSVLDWAIIGGTSVASPAVAAIVNSAGRFERSSAAELKAIYDNRGKAADFTDITEGSCINAASGNASVGYDLCTGIGTPFGLKGK
jgi:subtilase family serine protease